MGSYDASTVFNQGKVDLQDQDRSRIQTVPELIEHNALYNPEHVFCIQAQKQARKQASAPGLSLRSVSYFQLKLSIARCQAWLLRTIVQLRTPAIKSDGTVEKGRPIALFVESDVGLLVHLFSFMSLGVPVILLSARLGPSAIHHLLHKTTACAVITSPRFTNTAREGLSLFAVDEEQPSLYTQATWTSFLEAQENEDHLKGSICRPGYFAGINDRNVLILHSSGTTGLPKPIYQSHTWLLGFTKCHEFYSDEEALGLNLSTLPLYHVSNTDAPCLPRTDPCLQGYGLVTPALSLGIGKTLCIPPPSVIPTGDSIISLLKYSKARSLMSVPSILEEIAAISDGQGIEALASLQFVAFGGGLLKRSVGLKLADGGVKILNHYGSTESGPIAPFFVPGPDYDWNYFRMRQDVPVKLEPASSAADGIQSYTLTMRPLGWQYDFIFQDQLVNNPLHPDTDFSAVGRTDDLIVLANGEKVIPRVLESALFESEHVKAAMAFGEGQFEIGVLVQPSMVVQAAEYDHFKSLIWPTILEAMKSMDAHARIASKEGILLVPHDTVLPRSDKGSLMRREVYKLFDAEIAAVYETLENSMSNDDATLLNMDDLERDLKVMIQDRLAWKVKPEDWTFGDDLFELGMDSLQAVQLRRYILSSLPSNTPHSKTERVPRDIVYRNPTVAELARFLRTSSEAALQRSTTDDFVEQFAVKPQDKWQVSAAEAVVLMTGGTGGLGSHLLAQLASLSNVARVFCLNRLHSDSNAQTRQLEAFLSRNITIDPEALDKIKVFQSNTASPLLGLPEADYAQIQDHVTHIIHNAWPMDFKRTLPSFKAQFQTLQNLLQLARSAHSIHPLNRPRVLFVSSIATVGQYPGVNEDSMVPEVFMTNERCANDIGYAKAKLVCERIIEKAAHDLASHMEVACVRIGQMSGSKQSGNIAAATLADILLSSDSYKGVYHLENPIRQSWDQVLRVIAPSLNIPTTEFIPFDQWIDKICAVPAESDNNVPVKKLEGFFRADFEHMACGNVVLDTKNAREVSPTLRRLGSISHDILLSYIRYWKSIGYLN
ncbi:MAG: hypothetical protein Q9225_000721 [Loekoesia sp. 1 TL-2023]